MAEAPNSQFFRDMSGHDEELCGSNTKEIVLDANPTDLAFLLDLSMIVPSSDTELSRI